MGFCKPLTEQILLKQMQKIPFVHNKVILVLKLSTTVINYVLGFFSISGRILWKMKYKHNVEMNDW